MFHSAAVRLAGLYLAIIMAISLFFSYGLYTVSSGSIESGLRQQLDHIERLERLPLRKLLDESQIRQLYDDQLSAATRSLAHRLIWINVGILIIGGLAAYWLARRSLEPIERSHDAQSRFASDASHELRTPLAVMQSEIEVAMRDKKLTLAQAKQLLSSNLEELAKLTALSSGLLRLARSQQNGITKEALRSEEVISEAAARLSAAAKAKNITIQTPDTSITIFGDKPSLVELVAVLLDNAIKYSPANSAVVIEAQKQKQSAVLRVTDRGQGIGAKDLPQIFERFYRADQKQPGHGLGLAIAKSIADMHGATLTADSKLGKGSTFTLDLPSA